MTASSPVGDVSHKSTMLKELMKCLALIDRSTVWEAAIVAVLALVAVVLETLGIGLIFVFVQILVDPARADQMKWIGTLLGPAVVENDTRFLTAITLGLLAVFIAKNIILLGFYYVQARFVAMNEAILATRLLESYLKGAYFLHLPRNSADFIRNLTGAVTTVFSTVIMGFTNLASELVVVAALTVLLLAVEPALTLGAILVLGAAVALFFALSRRRFATWGRQEQTVNGRILKALQQGFHSIKEVKILGRQDFIRDSFADLRRALARIHVKTVTMTNAPRLWIEAVTVTTVLLAIVFILSAGGDSAEILSALTLFAAAAFRMIPSMNRIIVALNGVKAGAHAVDLIYQDLLTFRDNPDEATETDERRLPFDDTLAVAGLSFRYPQGDGVVLKDADLTLHKGESLGLVGPSGSGKSTLVDIVLGLLAPTSGSVTVDGVDIFGAARAWRCQIGYVPQSIYIIDDTLRRNIAFGLRDDEIDDDKVRSAIRLSQLDAVVEELPNGLDTPLGERGVRLSGGQRQRVGIARALYRDPNVLIFDEATSSLDSETEHEINNAVQRLRGQKTLIIIAHRLSTVRQCDRLAFLEHGRVSDVGTFEELTARNANFRNLVELATL